MSDTHTDTDTDPEPVRPDPAPSPGTRTADGTRTGAGSNYGDFVPAHRAGPGKADPTRGAEFERDALPDDADFSVPVGPQNPQAR